MKNVNTMIAKSRAAARTMKSELIAKGFEDAKVIDNGADSKNRWTVEHTAPASEQAEQTETKNHTTDEIRAACALVRAQLALKESASKVKRPTKKWEFVNPNHGKQQRRKEKKAPILAKKNRQPVKENALTIALQVAFQK